MDRPEDLIVDDLQDGERLHVSPETVGVRHCDFGPIAGHVAFIERLGELLVAELSDGRRYEVRNRRLSSLAGYALCRLGE